MCFKFHGDILFVHKSIRIGAPQETNDILIQRSVKELLRKRSQHRVAQSLSTNNSKATTTSLGWRASLRKPGESCGQESQRELKPPERIATSAHLQSSWDKEVSHPALPLSCQCLPLV
jgi:hypothetical protein